MEQPRVINPISLAVAVSLAVVAFVMTCALAIGGSYALTVHALHTAQAAQNSVGLRDQTAQIRESVPICRALVEMDNASVAGTNGAYEKRLAAAIHDFARYSKCRLLLQLVAQDKPFTVILQRLKR